jgi:hypothetical protein
LLPLGPGVLVHGALLSDHEARKVSRENALEVFNFDRGTIDEPV